MMNELQELISQQFHKDNFLIQTEDVSVSEKYAVIYCSSNGVYRQDTVEDFRKSIIEKDNYEWFMTRVPYARKHIFIRDIKKKFYKLGINDGDCNSPEKTAEMLKKETEGYKVITIGSSAGGTMAVYLGKVLNADFTIAFSPMLKTYKTDKPQSETADNSDIMVFFDDTDFAKSDVPIFYIYPDGSEWDIYNSSLVKDYKNVYFLPIKSDIHGVPLNKRILKKLLTFDKETLKNLIKYKTTDSVNEYRFAREMGGWSFYMLRVWDYIRKYPLFFLKKDFYNLVLH